jgi:hypothetical protein
MPTFPVTPTQAARLAGLPLEELERLQAAATQHGDVDYATACAAAIARRMVPHCPGPPRTGAGAALDALDAALTALGRRNG